MKQALHIFWKDIRHLWPQIAVVLALVAAHAALDVLQTPDQVPETERINQLAGFSKLLLVLAWWNLMAAAIYEEALPGDRQFWVTRPYSWTSLLGAKLLFIVAFVNAPLLLSDCFVLSAQGFPVLTNLPDLLLREPVVSGWLIVPALAIATVTRGLGQFVLALLILLTSVIFESAVVQFLQAPVANFGVSFFGTGTGVETTQLVLVLLGCILFQFAKRRTGIVRCSMAAYAVVIGPWLSTIPWHRSDVESATKSLVDVSQLRLSFDLTRDALPNGAESLVLPVRVSGLPEGTALIGSGEVTGYTPKQDLKMLGVLERAGTAYVITIRTDAVHLAWMSLHRDRLSLRSSMRLMVVSDRVRTKVPAQQQKIAVPDVGFCEVDRRLWSLTDPALLCQSAVRTPAATLVQIADRNLAGNRAQIGSPGAGQMILGGLSPVAKWVTQLSGPNPPLAPGQILSRLNQPGTELLFTPQRVLAQTRVVFEVHDADLSSFVPRQY